MYPLALLCLLLYFNQYWLMLPSLISLSGRLFLLVEIINLALSCYLVCQLCMWCILQFKGVEVLSDCFHCCPEYLVWKDYIFRDCLALLV